MRIIFMGSPQFAVPSLVALHAAYEVAAVITAPDKPAGRGKQMQETAVKHSAEALGIPVMQPSNLKDENFLNDLAVLKADLFVVVAFRMLPGVVFEMPPMGCINLHASLLPDYRGAAPINWAIINGESKSGLTTFFIEKEIDTGLILLQAELSISDAEAAGSLHDRMMEAGADLLVKTARGLDSGQLEGRPQMIEFDKTYPKAPKLFRETGLIDWQNPALSIHNLIRGLNPFPGSYSAVSGLSTGDNLKIWTGKVLEMDGNLDPGKVEIREGNRLIVGTGEGKLELLEVQAPGKKRVSAADFLRGIHTKGEFFFQ